jgi:hypothetical protein
MKGKVFSLDGENYNIHSREEVIDSLTDWKTKNRDELLGKEYFEGDPVKPAVGNSGCQSTIPTIA